MIRAAKPRLTTTHSESSLTTFLNGHHKPTHKHHISHGSHGSSPYHIPAIGHTGHNFGEHMGCTKSPPLSVVPISRRNKSEQSSPDLRVYPALNMPTNNITPLELTPHPPPSKPPMQHRATSRPHTVLSVNTNHHRPFSMHDYPTSGQDLLPSADSEFQFSAGLFPSQSAGWPNTFSTQFSTSASFEELSLETYEPYQCYNPPPPLTNSASGDEPEEVGPYSGPSPPYGFGSALSSNSSEHAESDNYHLSAASSYVALSQAAAAFPEFDRLLVTAAAYDNGPAGTEEMFVPYHSGATSGAFTEMGKLEEEAAGVQEDDFLWMGAGRW